MNKVIWVIKDECNNNFISLYQTERDNYCIACSGICPGFMFYSVEKTGRRDLEVLNNKFILTCMNLASVPKGKVISIDLNT